MCNDIHSQFEDAILIECPLPEPPSLEYDFDFDYNEGFESSFPIEGDTGEVDNLLIYQVPIDQRDLLLAGVSNVFVEIHIQIAPVVYIKVSCSTAMVTASLSTFESTLRVPAATVTVLSCMQEL